MSTDTLFILVAAISGATFVGLTALDLVSDLDSEVSDELILDEVHLRAREVERVKARDARGPAVYRLRAFTAGATVFGLTGLAVSGVYSELQRLILSLGTGFGTTTLVRLLFQFRQKLEQGQLRSMNGVQSARGHVAMTIPKARGGVGSVVLQIGEQMREYPALTAGDAIVSGAAIEVVRVVLPGAVEVRAVPETVELARV